MPAPEVDGVAAPTEIVVGFVVLPAIVTDWSVPSVIAVVGVAPVWNTKVPVVSATTEYAVVLVVDDLIVLI